MSIFPDVSIQQSDIATAANRLDRRKKFNDTEDVPINLGSLGQAFKETGRFAPVDSSALASTIIALQRVGVITSDSSKLSRVLELVRDLVIKAGFFGKDKIVTVPVVGLCDGLKVETAYARSLREASEALEGGAVIVRTDGRRATCITELQGGEMKEFDPFMWQSRNVRFDELEPFCVGKPTSAQAKTALIVYQPGTLIPNIRADRDGTFPRRSINANIIADFVKK